MSISEKIGGEVLSWEGTESRPHRFGGVEFRVNGHEIGHLHGDRLADLPFPRRIREQLVAEGKAQTHHVLPQTGWVSYRIRGEEDLDGALDLFRRNYERLTARKKEPGGLMETAENEAVQQHPIRDKTGYALAKVCRAHRGNVGELLAELGLHVGQEMVLIELWEHDGLRGGELATRLGVEPPTVTKMLRRLENCDLLTRRPDPTDARSFRIFLTKEGRALEEPVTRCWERVEQKTFAGLSTEERRSLHELLAKVRSHFDPGFRPA